MIAVLRHVGVDLVLADDDQVHVCLDHRANDVWPAGKHVLHDLPRAQESHIIHVCGGDNRHSVNVDVLLVERASRAAVRLADDLEERLGRGCDLRGFGASNPGGLTGIAIGRLFSHQVPDEEVLHSPQAVGTTQAMIGVGYDDQLEVFPCTDQRIGQAEGRFRWHVRIHLTDDQHQFAAEPGGVVDIRRLCIPGPHRIAHPLLVPRGLVHPVVVTPAGRDRAL